MSARFQNSLELLLVPRPSLILSVDQLIAAYNDLGKELSDTRMRVVGKS